jgi:carboxyl-terminal processing protease
MNPCRTIAAAWLLAALTSVHAAEPGVLNLGGSPYDLIRRFASTLEVIGRNYVEPGQINAPKHSVAALRAYVRSLDPDADLLTAEEVMALRQPNPAVSAEPGIALALREGKVTVVCPLEGSPAQNAGLIGGEGILSINGQSTREKRLSEVVMQMRGPAGSSLVLEVGDAVGKELRIVKVERTELKPRPVCPAKFLGDGVAYLRLPEFATATMEPFLAELKRVQAQKPRGLVLDLRNNQGGMFDAMMIVADALLPAKAEVTQFEYPDSKREARFVSGGSVVVRPTVAVVVLVNGGTAGTAEILAAALRDNKRAHLVGSTTFGHGRLVSPFPLEDGNRVLLPTAYYRTPSGKRFHGVGVAPDEVVTLAREEERRLSTAGYGTFNWVDDREAVLKSDLQLARAFALLQKSSSK